MTTQEQAQVKLLGSQRANLKRKVTLCHKALLKADNLTPAELQQLYDKLQSCYDEFMNVHLEYVELVESDDVHSEYRIVNGLDFDDYLESVDKLYTDAKMAHRKHLTKFLEASIAQAIDTTDRLLSSATVEPKLVANHIDTCRGLTNQFLCVHGSRHSELHRAIIELSCVHPSRYPHNSDSSVSSGIRSSHLSTSSNPIAHVNVSVPNAESTRVTGGESEQAHNIAHRGAIVSNSVSTLAPGLPTPADAVRSNQGIMATPLMSNRSAPLLQPPYSSDEHGHSVNPVTLIDTGVSDKLNIVTAYSGRVAPSLCPVDSGEVSSGSQPPWQGNSAWQESEYKKMPLPRFSGDPCDWPEFRTIWRRYIAHATQNGVDQVRLVYQLKQCLSGEAKERVAAIYATQARPLEHMFEALESVYSDIGSSVQFSLAQLCKLGTVREGDYKGLITFVNSVERCYSQLAEVGQLTAINLTHIDDLTDKLPFSVVTLWMNQYQSLPVKDRIHPFSRFMLFLSSQRDISQRYANRQMLKDKPSPRGIQPNQPKNSGGKSKFDVKCFQSDTSNVRSLCVVHAQGKHDTVDCKAFLDMTVKKRFEALASKKLCFRCFGQHFSRSCQSKMNCKYCKSDKHHSLLCNESVGLVSQEGTASATGNSATVSTGKSHHVVFAVQSAKVKGVKEEATLFFDSGSNSTFITRDAVKRLKARRQGAYKLDLTTMGGGESKVHTHLYEVELVTSESKVVVISAFCMDYVTGPVKELDLGVLSQLFPALDVSAFQRSSREVDILLGVDYEGLHPGDIVAEDGANLRVKSTPFGAVLVGSHTAPICKGLSIADPDKGHSLVGSHTVAVSCNRSQAISIPVGSFIQGEELGTLVTPKCGSCKCGKCPIAGHTYSFGEEQELGLIRSNLRYDKEGKRWITKYPWVIDPHTLPNNYSAALATLRHTEKVLSKDEAWARVYGEQIQDMVDRGVAKVLSQDVLDAWHGPVFYLSHLAVVNPKSASTPVRIVFNSSQVFQGYSLNGALAKGPDAYLNSLLGVLLRWREGHVALIADIKKMYNSIFIEDVEQHCHRFLWRNLDTSRSPDVYAILRVNMGDKPAGAISTEAVYLTAEMFQESHPQVAKLLRTSTYVDDIADSVKDESEAVSLALATNEVLASAGFKVKHWLLSGENGVRVDPAKSPERGEGELRTKVLGVSWTPARDVITFRPSLNFSAKKRGVYCKPDVLLEDIPKEIPVILTRRSVLEQVMKVYDPFGFLAPFTLIGKILLRKTWMVGLGWDDPLPSSLWNEWAEFFTRMFEFSSIEYKRSLMPASHVGLPKLVILSDGSDLAYGCVAYIRWTLADGGYWSRLVMAKCRIAPVRKATTPQMELNGAVLSKRIRKVLENELRFTFDKVYQLVDSETVLHMVNKVSTRFKIYEGVRIGEIQQATNGDMSDWFWLPGTVNISDWVTRGRMPSEIGPGAEWWNGPTFLSLPEAEWPIKDYQEREATLPGEKHVKQAIVHRIEVQTGPQLPLRIEDFSSARTLVYRLARHISVFRLRSFRGWLSRFVTPELIQAALELIVKVVQESMQIELKSNAGQYRKLLPHKDSKGIWVVGARFSRRNPMTSPFSNPAQILIPYDHWFTLLLMRDAHEDCEHRGRDSTLARFRLNYWVTRGSALASKVVTTCYQCRKRDPKLLTQQMGQLPEDRLKPAPPFTSVMLDLFGPYAIRGEVQKRVTGKGYGILFTDMFSRAVHIEGVFAYDTQSFLNGLTRFTSIRGWPEVIYSDCGTQIVAASNAMKAVWDGLDHSLIVKASSRHGLRWVFGPPDAPWHQGAVEALVKTAKRAIHFAVGDRRLSASEFLTVCARAANIMNERPLGRAPGVDSEVNLFTPNCLLIGRPIADQPGGLEQQMSPNDRLALIETTLNEFWKVWVELYAPVLMCQNRWVKGVSRELRVGDVVLVTDANARRGQYTVGVITEVFPGCDGRVRKVALERRNCSGAREYKVNKPMKLIRAAQRLALLVPVEGEGMFV